MKVQNVVEEETPRPPVIRVPGVVALAKAITFRRAPTHYYDGGIPEYTAYVDGEWVGHVYQCPWDIAAKPVCFCKKWHGATWNMKVPGHPTINVTGYTTRKDVARALKAVDMAWVQVTATPEGN